MLIHTLVSCLFGRQENSEQHEGLKTITLSSLWSPGPDKARQYGRPRLLIVTKPKDGRRSGDNTTTIIFAVIRGTDLFFPRDRRATHFSLQTEPALLLQLAH